MPASVTLVTGTGTTRTARGYRLTRWPWIFIGGTVSSTVIPGATGNVTYYGLDNSTVEVLRLRCYRDIVITPETEDFENYCDGVKQTETVITQFTSTMTITDDVVDLYYLRRFLRQSSGNYNYSTTYNIEALRVGDVVTDWIPVLWEHHYTQATSTADEYIGILAFEAQLMLGDITGNYSEGYSSEMTIQIRYSDTYDGYLGLMRHDDVLVV
jgi:hypothetical protein